MYGRCPARSRRSGRLAAADFDVFEGWEVTGWPVTTVLRGQVVYADGQVTSEPGSGQLVKGRREPQ
jgi:dihydropyrimidinase